MPRSRPHHLPAVPIAQQTHTKTSLFFALPLVGFAPDLQPGRFTPCIGTLTVL